MPAHRCVRWLQLVPLLSIIGCSSGSRDASSQGGKPDAGRASDNNAPLNYRTPAQVRAEGNQLVDQPSPYLLQHAHNPVDWYPWGPQALAKAQAEQKPIFLSVGYSTCHWCHVMEKESFEDDEVAEFLNRYFVSIKVDREQRPDVDALYIDAVRNLGGSTGWPLTVFLTPNLEPYFGGTYFPRNPGRGRPGFLDVLGEVLAMWNADGEGVAAKGRGILEQVQRQALATGEAPTQLDAQAIDVALDRVARVRDMALGGFGNRTKFPNAPLLLAELRHVKRSANQQSRDHLVLTLEQIMRGGIRDHVGGTFHRYSVDARWHIPHFEKTLYDNAQLAGLYIEAGLYLQRSDFVSVGRAVLDDLERSWFGPDGGVVVGFDADDAEGEGAFYSWSPLQLVAVLGQADAKVMSAAFGVTQQGDHELRGRSVLHRRADEEVAAALGLTVAQIEAVVKRSLPKLAKARESRPKPAVDDKALVAWNGLALMTFSDAGRWLDEPRYVAAGERIAEFITQRCRVDGQLQRGLRQGVALGPAFADDHALAGLGLLRLHAATGDPRWLTAAREIADVTVDHFYDPQGHVFLRALADANVPVRMADMEDGVMPSGGSAGTLLALELGALSGESSFYDIGDAVLRGVVAKIQRQPFSSGYFMVALDHAVGPVREVVLAGDAENPATASLWAEVAKTTHARIVPARVPAKGAQPEVQAKFPALVGKRAQGDQATAYVCERGRCEAPTSDPAELRRQLKAAAL